MIPRNRFFALRNCSVFTAPFRLDTSRRDIHYCDGCYAPLPENYDQEDEFLSPDGSRATFRSCGRNDCNVAVGRMITTWRWLHG